MTRAGSRPTPTAVSMRRWLCAWLALLVALQVLASVSSGSRGSLHRHRSGAVAGTAIAEPAVLRWQHDKPDGHAAHIALHARGELHRHDLRDTSAVPLSADVASEALAQLAVAFAPVQPGGGQALRPDHARHALPHAALWWAATRAVPPPLKPPRA